MSAETKQHPYGIKANVEIPADVAAVFWTKAIVLDAGSCWEWKLAKDDGYGKWSWQRDGVRHGLLAHRAAWMIVHGVIPPGLTVDHRCRNHGCVNPSHLRLLGNVDNARDNQYLGRTHCVNNHELSGANLYEYFPKGAEHPIHRCVECRHINARRWYERRVLANV